MSGGLTIWILSASCVKNSWHEFNCISFGMLFGRYLDFFPSWIELKSFLKSIKPKFLQTRMEKTMRSWKRMDRWSRVDPIVVDRIKQKRRCTWSPITFTSSLYLCVYCAKYQTIIQAFEVEIGNKMPFSLPAPAPPDHKQKDPGNANSFFVPTDSSAFSYL